MMRPAQRRARALSYARRVYLYGLTLACADGGHARPVEAVVHALDGRRLVEDVAVHVARRGGKAHAHGRDGHRVLEVQVHLQAAQAGQAQQAIFDQTCRVAE